MVKAQKVFLACALSLSSLVTIPTHASSLMSSGNLPKLGNIPPQPPAGFDPLTASPELLVKYGFPERPTDPGELSAWENAMKKAKNYLYPVFKSSTRHSKTIASHATSAACSPNWSGYIANPSSTDSFTKISGNFVVPNVSQSIEESYSSSWVGLGGYGSPQLIQAGSESDVYVASGMPIPKYYVWWEALPDYPNQQTVQNFSVQPGDTLYVHITYDTSTGVASFFLEDLTTNTYVPTFQESVSNDYNGSTAEWVVERTEESGSFPPLAKFNSDYFSNAYAGTDSLSQGLGSWYNFPLNMDDANGNLLAYPSTASLTNTTFTDYWNQYGPWESSTVSCR